MKIKTGVFLVTLLFFLCLGLPSTGQAMKSWKEYSQAVKKTKALRASLQEIDRQKSRIQNDINAKTGIDGGNVSSVTEAIAQIPGVAIQKIVASKCVFGKEEVIATLHEAEEVKELSQDVDQIEYTLQMNPDQMAGVMVKLDRFTLDTTKTTLLVPNGLVILTVVFGGGV